MIILVTCVARISSAFSRSIRSLLLYPVEHLQLQNCMDTPRSRDYNLVSYVCVRPEDLFPCHCPTSYAAECLNTTENSSH